MMFIRLLRFLSPSAAYVALKAIWKAARTTVKTGKTPKGVSLPTGSWAQRFWSALMTVFMVEEVVDFFISIGSRFMGLGMLAFFKVAPDHATDVVELVANQIISFEPLATRLAASTMTGITGIPIDPESIGSVNNAEEGRARAINLGEEFMQVVSSIFSVPAAAQDFQTRTGHSGSANNLSSYFGTNLFFQLRSLTIATVASLTGWHTLRHLEALHQSVNWAFGFGWLSWAVMSEFMNVTVNPGMRRLLNSQVKPNDYSDAEARWAFWAGFLTLEQYHQIMDNSGARPDTRGPLLDRAQANLSDAELLNLYYHGRITQHAWEVEMKYRPYGQEYRDYKWTLLTEKRLWDTLDDIDNVYLDLYRDCVVSRNELDVWLTDRGWKTGEIDAVVAREELERRRRRWLSDKDLQDALEIGLMSGQEVKDYLVCQGMTELDATLNLVLMLKDLLPKDCLDKIRPEDYRGTLNAVLAFLFGSGALAFPRGMLKLADCLGVFPLPIPGPGGEEEKAPKVQLPTGGISVLPSRPTVGDQIRLQWSIEHADTVDIDQGVGRVQAQGVLFLVAEENTVWTLTAKNSDGERTFQTSILVRPAPEPKLPKPPLPSLTFSVSPARITEGEEYTMVWSAVNADQVFIDSGEGAIEVSLTGGKILVADHNRVFTAVASGPGGQRQRSDALIVRPRAEEGIAKPSASLNISPGRATAGDRVEVRWSTSNATLVTLRGIGGAETVGPVGARIITADHDRIVSLTAANPETGQSRSSVDALIVDPPEPETPPTAPVPTASLTLRPSSTDWGKDVAVEWRTSNAEQVTLMNMEGVKTVDPVDARIDSARQNDIYILRAKGAGGERALAKVLLVRIIQDAETSGG